jgi:hypothetical protein
LRKAKRQHVGENKRREEEECKHALDRFGFMAVDHNMNELRRIIRCVGRL